MQIPANNRLAGVKQLDLDVVPTNREVHPSSTRPATDRVSLSPQALSSPPPAPASQSSFSATAHADPSKAEALAHDFAYTEDRVGMDISGWPEVIRYAATGEVVTPESEAAFAKLSSRIRAERISLYEAEKGKGTPAAEIFDKISAFMSTQSSDYLRHTGWDRVIAE